MEKYPIGVSVIMPVWNQETDYLNVALSSTKEAMQRLDIPSELIIFLDGPDDNHTADDVMEFKYANGDIDILIIASDKNRGICYAVNEMRKYAKYEFIAYMDSDDMMESCRLKLESDTLLNDESIFLCAGRTMNEIPWYTGIAFIDKAYNEEKEFTKCEQMRFNHICHPTIMYRKSVCMEHKLDYDLEYITAHDFEFYQRALSKGLKIKLLNTPVLYYRRHENNDSKKHLDIVNEELDRAWLKNSGLDIDHPVYIDW